VNRRSSGGSGASRRAASPAEDAKRSVRSDGSPRRAARGAAPKRDSGRDGAPRREPRGAGGSKRDGRSSGPPKRDTRGSASKRTGRASDAKRTSRNSDERNPTRSGVDYPSRKFRAKNEVVEPLEPSPRSSLRKVRRLTAPDAPARTRRAPKERPASTNRRRRLRSTEAGEELARIAGRGAPHAQTELARAAEAFSAGRERDAARLLRPLRDAYPDASAVRELLGLSQYRLGQYAAATKELEAFVELTNSVEQHPVLMDCARALGKHRRVDELWEELAAASPTGALVTEGRIVLAGSRADQGRLTEAIATLDRRAGTPNRVQDHHVRVWYALADLYERAGDLPKARELFLRIRRHDAGFADAAERLAALG
jgi:tetratricopeptide (TPR) repeat protein